MARHKLRDKNNRTINKLIRNAVLLGMPVKELADTLRATPKEVLQYCVKNQADIEAGLPI